MKRMRNDPDMLEEYDFSKGVRGKYAELTGFITEYVQGVPIIQLYNRKAEIRRELSLKNADRYRSELKAMRVKATMVLGMFTSVWELRTRHPG